MYQLSAPRIVLSAFPLSGIAWLLSLRAGSTAFKKNTRAAWVWMFAAGSVAVVLLLVLWLPARQYSLAACRDMDSLVGLAEDAVRSTLSRFMAMGLSNTMAQSSLTPKDITKVRQS
jgi:hypothetical protein